MKVWCVNTIPTCLVTRKISFGVFNLSECIHTIFQITLSLQSCNLYEPSTWAVSHGTISRRSIVFHKAA